MSLLGRLAVDIIGNNSSYINALNGSQQKTESFTRKITSQQKILRKAYKQVNRDLQDIANAGTKMTTFVSGPLLGLGVLAGKTAGEIEDFKTSFETLLKSPELAAKAYSDVEKLTSKTNLFMSQVAVNAERLIGYEIGVNKLSRTLRNLGNAAKGVPADFNELTKAYGKVKTQTKLTTEVLNQFQDRGINILKQLALNAGVSTEIMRKSISEGKVTFEEFDKALDDMTNDGGLFAGYLEKKSATLFGAISTMIDNVKLALSDVVKGVIPEVKKAVLTITELAQKFRSLDSATKENILKIGLFVMAIGPAITGISKMALVVMNLKKSIFSTVNSFKSFATLLAANPWVLAAAAIAAVTAAIGIYVYRATSTADITRRLTTATRHLKETQAQYKEVVSELNDKTKDLNESERFLLEQRKRELALKISENLIQIGKEWDNLNKKRWLRLGKSNLDADKEKLQEVQAEIDKYTTMYNEAKAAGHFAVKFEYGAGYGSENITLYELAEKIAKKYEEQIKLKKRINGAEGKTIEAIDQIATALHDQVLTENDLFIIQSRYPDLYKLIIDQYSKIVEAAKEKATNEGKTTANLKDQKTTLNDIGDLENRRLQFLDEWQKKALEQNKTRIQMLDIEKEQELKKARELFTNKKKLLEIESTITAYYENEKKTIREKFEYDYTKKYSELVETRITLLEREKSEAIKEAEQIGASKISVIRYYDRLIEEARQTEQDKAEQHHNKTVNFYISSQNQVSNSIAGIANTISNSFYEIINNAKKLKNNITGLVGKIFELANSISGVLSSSLNSLFSDQIQELKGLADTEFAEIDQKVQAQLEAQGLLEETRQQRLTREIEALQEKLASETDLKEKAKIRENLQEKRKELERAKILEAGEKEKEKVKKKYALREYQLKIKQFIAQKTLDIIQAGIATASGILNVWSNAMKLMFPMNMVVGGIGTGVMTGVGAAQIGIIASKQPPPPPQFGDGGLVTGPTLAEIGERGDKEVVFPLTPKVYKNFAEQILNTLYRITGAARQQETNNYNNSSSTHNTAHTYNFYNSQFTTNDINSFKDELKEEMEDIKQDERYRD